MGLERQTQNLLGIFLGLVVTMMSAVSAETYDFIDHQALLAKKPTVDTKNVKVWNIRQDPHIRINYVEMYGELPLHKHPDAAHSLMVLSGTVKVQIGKEFKTLEVGDYISIPADVPHKYWPISIKVTLVSMDSPYYDPKKTVSLE